MDETHTHTVVGLGLVLDARWEKKGEEWEKAERCIHSMLWYVGIFAFRHVEKDSQCTADTLSLIRRKIDGKESVANRMAGRDKSTLFSSLTPCTRPSICSTHLALYIRIRISISISRGFSSPLETHFHTLAYHHWTSKLTS